MIGGTSRLALVLAVVVAAGVVGWRHVHAGGGGDAVPAPGAWSLGEGSAREELAGRYAPIVVLKDQKQECDSNGEAFAPVGVEVVLDNPDVVLRTGRDDAGTAAPGASGVSGKGEGYYLDLPGNPSKLGCGYERVFQAITEAGEARNVAYAHIVTEPGKRGVALQYWFFYYFNDWNNNHEGDWEMIQIVFDAATVEEALGIAPDHVGYSQHSGGERAAWDSDKLELEGDRPVVYVAAGSHSNQFEQENYLGRGEEGAGFGCDDATGPGTRVELDAVVVPETVSGPDDPFAWITYTGRWGERLSGEFNGPTGPNTKTQWTQPITWDETKLRSSNVQVPGSRTAGITPTNAFCGIVAFASQRLLTVVAAAPWILPVAAGAAGAALFVTVRNTDFGMAQEPLRRRRRFGQILRTSLAIYRANFWLMIGIALTFVPMGVVATVLQASLFRFSPLEVVLDVLGTPRLVDAVIALALGTGAFGLAYLAVVSGVVAAVREIEAGRPVSPMRAYGVVWRRLGDLLRARARALGITAGLAITVVGIPWAVRRAVEWLFIEHAMLLDDVAPDGAAAASAAAVRGSWWRTAAINGVLLGAGALTSLVAVAPIMLFATQVPLDTVNTISSLIYVLLSPWVALALVLLYFDARDQHFEDSTRTAEGASPRNG